MASVNVMKSKPLAFSIASILGNTTPTKEESKNETFEESGIADQLMMPPLQTSTPVPYYKTPTLPLDENRTEKWIMDNCKNVNLTPESRRRDILAESFALALGTSTPTMEDSPVIQRHDVGKDNTQGEETSSGYTGSDNQSSGSQDFMIHDNSFTSETTSRPESPDDQRRSKKARTSFTASQLCDLETHYRTQRYISAADRIKLARKLKLSDQQVKTWYQNRRMKEKRQVQDFEHAKKFHQTGAMIAAASAVGGPLPNHYHQVPTMGGQFMTPNHLHVPVSTYTMSHQPLQIQSQMSYTQLLNGHSPPQQNRLMHGSIYGTPYNTNPALGQISMLPIPSAYDVRSITGQYQQAPLVSRKDNLSAFTRIRPSII